MSADPDPGNCIRGYGAESAIVVSDANGEPIRTTLQPTKTERGMMRVMTPLVIASGREILNIRGEGRNNVQKRRVATEFTWRGANPSLVDARCHSQPHRTKSQACQRCNPGPSARPNEFARAHETSRPNDDSRPVAG